MNSVRWEYVKEIFDCSLELEPMERASFLDRVCSRRKGLRTQVDALLKAHASTRVFHRPFNPLKPPPAEPVPPPPAYRIENYWIERTLCRGGMSTIYDAQQIEPRRRVAIKVMDNGMEPHSAFQRALFESRIMARLDHPSIARVFEVGMHCDRRGWKQGRKETRVPFLVLEYIPYGRPVTEYVQERRPSLAETLDLFCIVCEAVEFTHIKGFIHRDLKPGNILVDLYGRVKLIDFGAALAIHKPGSPSFAASCDYRQVGTLQYMSPEQLRLDCTDLDPRSDVYALGLVLYEMLCRKPPYRVTSFSLQEAEREICRVEPIRPDRINSDLKGDLQRIVLKALEKERERRFDSARALARDIRAYLARGNPLVSRAREGLDGNR